MAANSIAENLFAQVEDEVHCLVMLQGIVKYRVNGREGTIEHVFIISHNGRRRKKETTLQWKDGSTTLEYLKDVKESYPVQVAKYAHHHKLTDEPPFTWWVPHVLN